MAMTSMFLSKVCIPEPSTLKVWSSWARPRQGLRGREGNGCVHLTCVRGLERDHLAPFLFLVVLGLCCRARTLFSCSARRLLVEAHERPLLSFCCACPQRYNFKSQKSVLLNVKSFVLHYPKTGGLRKLC